MLDNSAPFHRKSFDKNGLDAEEQFALCKVKVVSRLFSGAALSSAFFPLCPRAEIPTGGEFAAAITVIKHFTRKTFFQCGVIVFVTRVLQGSQHKKKGDQGGFGAFCDLPGKSGLFVFRLLK